MRELGCSLDCDCGSRSRIEKGTLARPFSRGGAPRILGQALREKGQLVKGFSELVVRQCDSNEFCSDAWTTGGSLESTWSEPWTSDFRPSADSASLFFGSLANAAFEMCMSAS